MNEGRTALAKEPRSDEQRARDRVNDRARRARKRAAERRPLPPPEERRRLRIAAGLNKTQLGERLGVTYYAIKGWELGQDPRRTTLNNAYAEALEELRATPSPVVDRAVGQLEHTWEAVLAAHNGHGWTDDQVARLRRLIKNVQMSVYKVKGGTDDDDDSDG